MQASVPTGDHRAGRFAAVLLITGLLVTAAACGNKDSGQTTQLPATSKAPDQTASSKAPGTTEKERSATTRTTSSGDEGGATTTTRRSTTTTSGGSSSSSSIVVSAAPENQEFCQTILASTQTLLAAAFSFTDPNGFANFLTELKTQYQKMTDTAPPAIKAQITLFNDKIQAVSSFQELSAVNNDASLKSAGDEVNNWVKANCGFDPNDVAKGSISSSGSSSSGGDDSTSANNEG